MIHLRGRDVIVPNIPTDEMFSIREGIDLTQLIDLCVHIYIYIYTAQPFLNVA